MAGIELASAYLTLIPSLKGASKSISAQLGGIDTTRAGQTLGRNLGGSMARAFSSDGVAQMETAVSKAEKSLTQAMSRSEDATKRVEIAQQALNEAVERYGEGSSQAMRAELELTKAQRSQAEAATGVIDAQTRLETAQKNLRLATDAASASASRQESVLAKASETMAKAAQGLDSAGSKLKSFGTGMAGVGDALMPVSTALIGGAAAAGTFALSTASAAETTEVSFTTMLGSAEAAEAMMQRLADFAARTPFELSGLQDATRQLLAYGFTAEDVIPMLTAVGDATAALGTGQAGIEAVTRALGQMQTRGKVSAEEMLQLTEAGIPAWEYLARAIGTDTAGAMEAVSKGAVSASDGIAALTKGMEQDFGGMMEQQSKTVAGLMSNLSDAIEQPLMKLRDTSAYERLSDALSDLVDAAGPFVESILPHLEDGLDAASGALDLVTGAMKSFTSMGRSGQKQVVQFVEAVAVAGPVLSVAGRGVDKLGDAMEHASNLLQKGSTALSKLADASGIAGTAASGLSGGIVGVGVAIAAVPVALFVKNLADMAAHEQLVEDATQSMDAVLEQASATASQSTGEMAASVADLQLASEEALQSMASLNADVSESFADLGSQSALLDSYVGTIQELAGQSDLTAAEQERLRIAVEGYNEVTGDSVSITNAVTGELSKSTDEIMANADAWEENARVQAYQSAAKKYFEEAAVAQLELSKSQQEYNQLLNEQTKRMAEAKKAREDGMMSDLECQAVIDDSRLKIEEATEALNEQSDAYRSTADNASYMSTQAAISMANLDQTIKDTLSTLPAELQAGGLEMANSLAAGISSGTVSVGAASRFIDSTVNGIIAELPPDMQQKGLEAANSLAASISSGEITVGEATTILKAAANGSLDSLPADLRAIAKSSVGNFASGIRSGSGDTRSAAGKVASAAATMDDVGDMWSSGNHLANNFANGIAAAREAVLGAAQAIADSAASILRFSVPESGPWSGRERGGVTSGLHLGENFASGMLAALPAVRSAAVELADAASPQTSPSQVPALRAMRAAPAAPAGGGAKVTNVYLDGRLLDVDGRVARKLEEFVDAVDAAYNMGKAVRA